MQIGARFFSKVPASERGVMRPSCHASGELAISADPTQSMSHLLSQKHDSTAGSPLRQAYYKRQVADTRCGASTSPRPNKTSCTCACRSRATRSERAATEETARWRRGRSSSRHRCASIARRPLRIAPIGTPPGGRRRTPSESERRSIVVGQL